MNVDSRYNENNEDRFNHIEAFESKIEHLNEENLRIRKELADESTKTAELRIENGTLQGKISQICM